MTYQVPFTLMTDFYKTGHILDYPQGTNYIQVNGTFRKGRLPDDFGVIWFGFQGAIQHYLVDYANETFFNRDVDEVCDEFEQAMLDCIGPNNIGSQHWRDLHDLGYLPLEVRSLDEGRLVPYGVPCFTIENTLPEFFWLPNWTETLISSAIWQATTSATIALRYRILLEDWAELTGTPPEFVDWQAHDFSFRGMSSPESAQLSGAGHLTAFTGTDTIPAIYYLKHYYHATGLVGGSVAATEHSVMCAGGQDDEIGTFSRLMVVHPDGILAVVSDTWNLWNVLTNILRKLKDQILGRNGKLVIRPDSGDPVKIICGDPDAEPGSPEFKGVIELLWEVFGGTVNDDGYRVLDSHVGAIYGDSINLDRANRICLGLAEKGFSSGNIVFGVGSFTYQYNTRDSHGFAIKATWSEVNGEEHMLFKDPITDDGTKRSARGRVGVTDFDGLKLVDGMTREQNNLLNNKGHNALELVWLDGTKTRATDLNIVRLNVQQEVLRRAA